MTSENDKECPLQILSLEDSPMDAELIREYLLENFGSETQIDRVANEKDYVSALSEVKYDLILADFKLPGLNGFQALEQAKSMIPSAPFICVSGIIGEETAAELIKQGATDFVFKEKLGRLKQSIERALKESKEAEEKEKRAAELIIANEELKYERNRARMYLDTAGVMIVALDKDRKINLINEEGCKVLKAAKEDILGKVWESFVPDSAREDVKQVFDRIIAGGIKTEQYHENSVMTADGEERVILWHNNPLRDTAGNMIGVLSSGTDITERKQSEAKITHLASFPRLNPDPIIELNQDGSINYANPMAKNIFPDLESVGARHPFLLNWQTAVKQLLAHENDQLVREIEVGDCIYSQTFNYIESSKTIRIYSQDITSRKQIAKALSESENLFRTSFESATVGIVMLGKNGVFIRVNDRACELWGYTREELLKLHFNDITYDEDQGISTEFFDKLISGELNDATFEKRYIKKDGTINWAHISTSAIRDETNNFGYSITYILDITDSKAVTEKINGVLEGTIETLALVVEARDPYTSGHQKHVAEIAVAIAENLGLSKGQVRGLYLASIVHDLGKIQVPSEILSKPGKLTNLEFELIKCHPETAYNLLKDIDFPWPVAEIVHQHHERIDGSGYPGKLKGESMLVEAKILCVADVYEAMSSHRPYRAAFPKEIALAEIEKNKGVLYDPDVVEACLKVLKDQ